jgi:hypothetical protein
MAAWRCADPASDAARFKLKPRLAPPQIPGRDRLKKGSLSRLQRSAQQPGAHARVGGGHPNSCGNAPATTYVASVAAAKFAYS